MPSGRLCSIGRAQLAAFAGQITMVEQAVGLSRYHIASFVDNTTDGVPGGGRFSVSLLKIVAGKIQGHVLSGGKNISPQWPKLSTEYGALKADYAPSFGQYRLQDILGKSVGIRKPRGQSSREVGIVGNPFVDKISFNQMRGKKKKKKIRVGDYHYWNEFGTESQPGRPLFGPSFIEVGNKYLPRLGKAVAKAIEADYKKLSTKLKAKVAGPMYEARGAGAVAPELAGGVGMERGEHWKDDDLAYELKKIETTDPELAAAYRAFGDID